MSIENKIRSLDFFKTISDGQLELLLQISSVDIYNKDYVFCYENETSNKLVFLLNGLAKAYKIDKYNNEIFLYYIKENSIISDISTIYNNEIDNFSNILFIEDSQVLSIDYKLFKKHFIDKNILVAQFINEVINKNQKLESLINREFIFDAVTKVAMMINSDLDMFNKLKRHDIALLLHIQPSTLSRVLNKLKKDNIIDIIHGKITVLDKQSLELFGEN